MQILLEKRPAPGIWGGLWSFPEAPARDVEGYCLRTLACEVLAKKQLEKLEHGFTHFRLLILPLVCEVARMPMMASPGRLWVHLVEADRAAVPAPVRKLVGRLMADSSQS
jgi:A/G-specific adenine glycosylase